MAKDERNTIEFEQGWEFIQKAITTLKNILERPDEQQFSPKDHNILYKIMYDIDTSIQNPPHDYLQWLYDKYRETIEEYITSTVLPSLMEKCDEFMLRELVKRWVNHQCMVKWLRKFLYFLDCYFTAPKSVPPLNEVGYACFNDLVYQEINVRARDVVITLIDKEREGEKIDRVLVKNVLDIFVKIGMGQMDCYENDFEKAMLKDTAAYYSRKVSSWISVYSCPDYLVEAEKCLESEKERVSHYLQSRSEPKLLDKVRTELLLGYANQLLENKHSGCRKLPRDDKVEDLSTMYRHFGCHRLVGHDKVKYLSKICMLFSEIPQCLELVSDRFKQHIIDEGTALVEQAKDAASDKKAEK